MKFRSDLRMGILLTENEVGISGCWQPPTAAVLYNAGAVATFETIFEFVNAGVWAERGARPVAVTRAEDNTLSHP